MSVFIYHSVFDFNLVFNCVNLYIRHFRSSIEFQGKHHQILIKIKIIGYVISMENIFVNVHVYEIKLYALSIFYRVVKTY